MKKQNAKPIDLNETYYRKYLFPNRLYWTKNFIPVRLHKYGLYIESMVHTISNTAQFIHVKNIFLPTLRETSEFTGIEYIYPTSRYLFKTDKESKELIPFKLTEGNEFDPPHRKITYKELKYIYMYMPNLLFTSPEIASLVNCTVVEADKFLYRSKFTNIAGFKRCVITTQSLPAWKISMPVEERIVVDKKESLIDLCDEYSHCMKCPLGDKRIARRANLVFGRGFGEALGMIIAEAPGRIEEQTKLTLNRDAPAGGILFRVMEKVKLNQAEWYFTNAVICRPLPEETEKAENGKPTDSEIKSCSTRLKRTIRSVSPRLVVICGNYAFKAFFGSAPEGGISKNLGWQTIKDGDNVVNYEVFVTYHPSYIARANSLSKEEKLQLQSVYLDHFKQIANRYEEIKKEYDV